MEINNWQGSWWFPEIPENKFAGNLIFSPNESIYLEITEMNKNLKDIFSENRQHKFIHGFDYSGKKITLYNAVLINRKSGFAHISICKYRISI
ncbi:MAG: hypothetical protein JXJ04_15170, partial [Spirochaetales bacterium]|nr:hypothetical protein [Spirochaetales bacterium]